MMRFIKFIALFSLSILLGACGGGGSSGTLTPTPAGDARAIITLEKSNLSTGEEVNVSARVADVAGNPVVGVKVTFSATAGMGTVTIVNDITDASGMAYAKLKATSNANGNTGQIKVTATVNGRAIENLANFYVNVPSNLKLSMLVSSSTVTVGGDIAVTFYVQNQDGTPYLDQVVDLNIASNYGVITGTHQGKVRTVISGGKNMASVTYWASSNGVAYAYQDTITATLNYSYESATITVNPLGSTASVAYNSASKTVLGFGDAATLTFYVTDASGTGRPSQSVSFSVTDETGITLSDAATVPSSAITDAYGAVRIILNAKAGTATKYVRVKATSGGVSTYSGVFTITQNPVSGSLALEVSSTDVKIGSMITATVTYAPTTGASPIPSEKVTIKDGAGAIVATGFTDGAGKAYINYAPSTAGTLTLYAEIGTLKSAPVEITVKSTDVSNGALTIAVSPTTAAEGAYVTATITYTNPNATILSGQTITIKSNNAAIIAEKTGTTDATGKAIINLKVADTVAANTTVTLWAVTGTIESPTTTVTVSKPASTLTLAVTASFSKTDATDAQAVTFLDTAAKVTFKDSNGNPITGKEITITLDPPTIVKSANGSGNLVEIKSGATTVYTGGAVTNPVKITTDSVGSAPLQLSIAVTAPIDAAAAQTLNILLLWKAVGSYQSVDSTSSPTTTIIVTTP